MIKMYFSIYHYDIAPLLYTYSSDDTLHSCIWLINKVSTIPLIKSMEHKKWISLEKQLDNYFKGKLKNFNIKIADSKMPDFTKSVLNEISKIKYGHTASYSNISKKLKKNGANQAIGQICKKNTLPIIIPCHRVIAKNHIGGYAGKTEDSIELKIKKRLLELEGYEI